MSDQAKRMRLYESMRNHQIRAGGTPWFPIPVTLLASDNGYISYPVRGMLLVQEQGVDAGISNAIFHALQDDGSLGAPCVVKNPRFQYEPQRAPLRHEFTADELATLRAALGGYIERYAATWPEKALMEGRRLYHKVAMVIQRIKKENEG